MCSCCSICSVLCNVLQIIVLPFLCIYYDRQGHATVSVMDELTNQIVSMTQYKKVVCLYVYDRYVCSKM